jgi:basic membrane lipoprotein Med (substrate-binding protein (PBP1-ABC) superfamily)
MTKLRALLEECGIDGATALTSAFGCYKLTLPDGAWIDVDAAVEALERAEIALAAGELAEVRSQAAVAAALARRSFLPGEAGPWVEERRRELHDLLVRSLECLRDACFAAGEFAEAVRHGEEVTELEPFRESGYRRLMQAHAAAGNPAEALRVYERCRTLLADELGAYPSPETEAAYLEILRTSSSETDEMPAGETLGPLPEQELAASGSASASRRRRAMLSALLLAAAVAAVMAVALVRVGGEGESTPSPAPRVAIVLPRAPTVGREDTLVTPALDGLRLAERHYGARTEILVADELNLKSPSVTKTIARLRSGNFDLVIVTPGGGLWPALGPTARALPKTRFVVFDARVDVPNATGFALDDHQAGYLAGYLSGLIEARSGPRLNRRHIVSAIGGMRGLPAVEGLLDGFAKGARRALPDISVRTAYSSDFVDQSKCDAIANRHIDEGADIVFAAAGTCSLGALSAAAIRGVWGVGVDGDRSDLGDHILASAVKRYDQAILAAVRSFVHGTLPRGRTVVFGLDADAVGLVGLSPSVPDAVRKQVARAAMVLRSGGGASLAGF